MIVKKFLVFFIAAALAVCGCATLRQLMQRPTVSLKDISARDISLFEQTLVFNFNVHNPNPVGIQLRNAAYNLKINNTEFIKGVLDKGIMLRAGQSETFALPVTVNHLELFSSVAAFASADSIPYNLSGTVGVGPFDIPYGKAGSFIIPKLPVVSLDRLKISELSLQGAAVLMKLNLANNNPFPVNISGLDYVCKLGEMELASGSAGSVAPVDQNGTSSLEVQLNLNFFELGTSAYNLLMQSTSDYELSGNMIFTVPNLGRKRFPFLSKGQVPFVK